VDNLPKKKWWQTLPAIIGGTTAFLSAITGFLLVLDKAGVFRPGEKTLSPDAWLSTIDYRKVFKDQLARHIHPKKVYGRLESGRQEFRAEWFSGRAPCPWSSEHEINAREFKKLDADYALASYVLSWKSEFADESGHPVIQAIWTQKCE
jgi:hypothetical protein